jgi:hypothetical protein
MATFAPYVNTGFYLLLNRKWVLTRLVELKNLCPKSAGQSVQNYGECFSLIFRAARGWKIEQKTHTLRHGALGTFSLFIVPVGRRGRASVEYYEAIINRRTQ